MTRDTRSSGAGDRRTDLYSGRRLALAIEALGEALVAWGSLPGALTAQAEALAQGRSIVPADGEGIDFPSRVRGEAAGSPGTALRAKAATPGVRDLEGWLGGALTTWVEGADSAALREATEVALEARLDVLDRYAATARAFCEWYASGLDETARAVFERASAVALGEAVDRWCALGCEGDLGRYVATWQRSASGWAEAVLGTAVDVPVGDLGRLRSLQAALEQFSDPLALRDGRDGRDGTAGALAKRLGWPRAEVERLLTVEAAVRDRLDPRTVLRRRWAIVKPIADAVAALERDLGRMPSVPEIADRAGVHEASVELALEAIGT